jgi:hypothetical protein
VSVRVAEVAEVAEVREVREILTVPWLLLEAAAVLEGPVTIHQALEVLEL